jgi:NADH dehydrogenase/NADH:ubiquinone oxidoreductase subunit G
MVVQWSLNQWFLVRVKYMQYNFKVIIFINNESFDFTTNLTIIQYLKLKGFNVPRFCYHEKLNIAGNCRMCLIEIEGISKPITSCTMQLNDNISIFTDSVMVRKQDRVF